MAGQRLPVLDDSEKIANKARKKRLPAWFNIKLPNAKQQAQFNETKASVKDNKLHTVCEEAKCPNIHDCWSSGDATFMIAGERCTRACGFCAVSTAKPMPLEVDEPLRVAQATKRLGLNHVVITAVARDDLSDGGAEHFARTVRSTKRANPGIVIEILVPDFNGKNDALKACMQSEPHI